MTNTVAIDQAVQQCANAYGKAYIPAQGTIAARYPGLRDQLEALSIHCGCTIRVAESATDGELISLYAVARKSPESAQRTAKRISDKYDKYNATRQLLGMPAVPQPEREEDSALAKLEYVHARIDGLEMQLARLEPGMTRAEGDALADQVTTAIDKLRDRLDAMGDSSREYVAELVANTLKAQQPTRLVVQMPEQKERDLGLVHYCTAELINWLGDPDISVYLHGPAGTGKTTAAKQVAKALGIPFYFAARVESEYLLFGFRDANGNTVRTQFREAYEHGGLFLFDEMDASGASAIVSINAALANGVATFPDAVVERHPDFRCIGAGNTVLNGASHQYTGRVALDAASVDRFVFMPFGYDENLERAVADNSAWCDHVQAVRRAVAERGLDHLVTPRATIYGCKLLARGATWRKAEEAAIFKGLDEDTVAQLRAAAGDALLSNAA